MHVNLRGERDVIRLRNPTEDKRAFRRMLTRADRDARTSSPDQRPGTSLSAKGLTGSEG